MKLFLLTCVAIIGCTTTGCGPGAGGGRSGQGPAKPLESPHGGTLVELGKEKYHLEFVFHPNERDLRLYVMDSELEHYVRLSSEVLPLRVRLSDRQELLTLKAATNAITGETVGNTSVFEGRADWLNSLSMVDSFLKEIEIQGDRHESIYVQIKPAVEAAGQARAPDH